MNALQRAAFGLSFFIVTLFAFAAHSAPNSDADLLWSNTFEADNDMKSTALVFNKSGLHSHFHGMASDTLLRAGKLGEFFITTALLQHMQKETISSEDPANFYLNDLQLLQPFGDIQLQHLLSRQTGLPLRQTHLYLSDGNRIPSLRDFIIQELKPAILPPGEVITHQSVGDLIPAQVLKEMVAQTRNREVPLAEIVSSAFSPLGWKNTEIFKGKTGQQYQESMAGSAAPFADFPAVWSATPDVHGYLTTADDLGALLGALISGEMPFEAALQKQIFSSPSAGLLKGKVANLDYFYLDSQWFGQQLRLAVFPERKTGFVLYYNKSNPLYKEQWTLNFAEQLTQKTENSTPTQPTDASTKSKIPLKLVIRDQISLLSTLDILRPTYLEQLNENTLMYQGKQWYKKEGAYTNKLGELLLWDGKRLIEKSGEQLEWTAVESLEKPFVQWLLAAFFTFIFGLIALRSLLKLWNYTPVQDPSEAEKEAWDLPLVSAISSLCAAAFAPIFYFGMLSSSVGQELSLVLRNQPTPALIGSLLLPLFSLVSGLILSLLLFNDWKTRVWSPFDKLIYAGYLVLLVGFLYWLAIWNVLGFRF